MSFIDRAFSIHDDAMMLRSRRSSILAGNIANADTPNYKARDIDFQELLQKIEAREEMGELALRTTNADHLSEQNGTDDPDLYYRNPLQPSLDGNTVDVHVEQARFSENAVMYQTSLTFLNSKIRGLQLAIKGQ
jgi:flagellar basal-body rod protein FlgB